ncbi:MAG: alanine racemase, partial [Chloroflexi bacterium]|nr:alanine racemase [Chloroflexota bacterium]
ALARRLNDRLDEIGKRVRVLLEVNVSGETSKYGLEPDSLTLAGVVRETLQFQHLEVRGLMTVAPIVADPGRARPYFRILRELRDEMMRRFPELTWPDLSMGMTDDFEAAIAEGATLVRIGRGLFGDRSTTE